MQLPDKWVTQAINKRTIEYGGRRSVSRGGRMIASSAIGHRLAFSIVTPPLNREHVRELDAFRDALTQNGVFTASIPVFSNPNGIATGAPTVRTSAAAGSKIIEVDNFSNSVSNIVKAGDFLTFANHTKGYSVAPKMSGGTILSYNTNGTGQTTLNLSRPLLAAVTAGELINVSNPILTLIPELDEWDIAIDAAKSMYQSIELPVVEYF